MKKIFLLIYKRVIRMFTGYGLIRYSIVRRLFTFFNSLLVPKFTVIDGHKVYLDTQDSLNLSANSNHEVFEKETIKKVVKEGNVVLDIGANIGDNTLIFAKLVGSKGRVYAFEPDPENFKLLKKNIQVNGYKNVILEQKAVSDKDGKIKLFLSENNKADHRIYDSDDNRKYVEVKTIKLDNYFAPGKKIDVVIVDIQGAEPMAFYGMKRILGGKTKPVLITEFWPAGLKRCGYDSNRYLKMIRDFGYTISDINERKSKVVAVSDSKLISEYSLAKEEYTNLLCTKK